MKTPRRKLKFILLISMLMLLVCISLLPVAASPLPLTVPLRTSADAAYLFFALINEHRLQDALGMMDAEMVPNETAAQAWAVGFNTIASVRVAELRRWESAGWNADQHRYKAILHITLKPGATYYGWENGVNVRWLTLQHHGMRWKMHEIATGP